MDQVDAHVLSESKDDRPDPGPMPTLFIIRWWEWTLPNVLQRVPYWNPRTSMFPIKTPLAADKEAADLIAKGCRSVQIVMIAGA